MSARLDALQRALAAEHAAIYAYGALGARLSGDLVRAAAEADLTHRARRDAAALLVVRMDAQPVPEARAYQLPALTSRAAAMALAIQVEQRCAAAWRAVLPDATGVAKSTAVDALGECAVWTTRWLLRSRPAAPATTAFPGG